MRRNGTVQATAYALALAALVAVPSTVRAASFDERWTAMEPAPKGDRLDVAAPLPGSKVIFLHDPLGRMTVAQKVTEMRGAEKRSPVRTVPTPPFRKAPDENARKTKDVMDGCEPFFSPVTMPSMANVAGRCIAALEAPVRIASVSG